MFFPFNIILTTIRQGCPPALLVVIATQVSQADQLLKGVCAVLDIGQHGTGTPTRLGERRLGNVPLNLLLGWHVSPRCDQLQGGIYISDRPMSSKVEKKEKMEALQNHSLRRARTLALTKKEVNSYEVIAATESFGTATLLSVRDTFKSPLYVILYTLFVLAASFHAFNGLWTFMISWGLIFRQAAQKSVVRFCIAVMAVIAMLGLAAIWGTFWLNLRY